jgi:transposase
MKRLIVTALVTLVLWQGYAKYQATRAEQRASQGAVEREAAGSMQFRCDGRTHCSHMTSCAEATFFLKNCHGVKMDARRGIQAGPHRKKLAAGRVGVSAGALALEAGVNANLLFKWRRLRLRDQRDTVASSPDTSPMLLPVTLAAPASSASVPRTGAIGAGSIEIDIGGVRVRLRGAVDEASLRCVLQVLRERA